MRVSGRVEKNGCKNLVKNMEEILTKFDAESVSLTMLMSQGAKPDCRDS